MTICENCGNEIVEGDRHVPMPPGAKKKCWLLIDLQKRILEWEAQEEKDREWLVRELQHRDFLSGYCPFHDLILS